MGDEERTSPRSSRTATGSSLTGESAPRASEGDPEGAAPAPVSAAPDTPGAARRTLTGGAWNAASLLLPLASTLALSVVISRRLGPALLGEQSLVAFVAALVVGLGVFSSTNASIQMLSAAEGAGDQERAAHLGRWSLYAHVAGGLLSATGLVVFGLWRDVLVDAWLLAAVASLFDAVGWAMAAGSIARNGWAPTGRRRTLAQLVAPLLGIAAVLAGLGVTGVFAAQALVSGLLAVSLYRNRVRRPTGAGRRSPAPAVRPVARLWGVFALAALIGQVVDRRIEFLFLERYAGPRDLAMYSVAFNVVGIGLTLCTAVTTATAPTITSAAAAGAQDRVRTGLARAGRLLLLVSLLLTAAVAVLGPRTVRVVYGMPFTEAADLVPLLALSLLVVPLGHLYSVYWTALGSLRPVLLSGASAAVVDLALARLLVPEHGASGAVVANLSAQTWAAAALCGYTWRRGQRVPAGVRDAVRCVSAAGTAGLASLLVLAVVPRMLGLLLAAAAFAATALVALGLLRAVRADDVAWLQGLVPAGARTAVGRLARPRRT